MAVLCVARCLLLGTLQQSGTGRDDEYRDAGGGRLCLGLLQQVPSRPLPHDDVDDQSIRVEGGDLLEGVGHEAGGGDVVVLFLKHVPNDAEEVGRAVDGEDVFALLLTAILNSRFPEPVSRLCCIHTKRLERYPFSLLRLTLPSTALTIRPLVA